MTFEDIKQDGRLWAFIMPMKLKMRKHLNDFVSSSAAALLRAESPTLIESPFDY